MWCCSQKDKVKVANIALVAVLQSCRNFIGVPFCGPLPGDGAWALLQEDVAWNVTYELGAGFEIEFVQSQARRLWLGLFLVPGHRRVSHFYSRSQRLVMVQQLADFQHHASCYSTPI